MYLKHDKYFRRKINIFKAFSTFTYNLKRLSRKILRGGGNILQWEKHNPPLSYHLLSSFPLSVCLLVLGFVFFTQSHYVFQVGLRLKISLLGLQVLGLQSFIRALVHILKGCSVKVNSQGCMSPLVPSEGGHTEKGTICSSIFSLALEAAVSLVEDGPQTPLMHSTSC